MTTPAEAEEPERHGDGGGEPPVTLTEREAIALLQEMLDLQHQMLVQQQLRLDSLEAWMASAEGRLESLEQLWDRHMRQHRPTGPESPGDALARRQRQGQG